MGWQDLVAGIAVLAAAAWLFGDVRRRRAAKAECASCALAGGRRAGLPPAGRPEATGTSGGRPAGSDS